ncbi:MAG: TIGR04211 family SH3 domain-containing protein [Desulfamplus sp.]|nr:TIGR04211 family SH3 domain-containing protein [Desulfamplus sp.]
MKTTQTRYFIYILSFFLYASVIPLLSAETGYVSDMLILSIKEGPGRQYNTIKTLRSNTPVEILETKERFLKIKTEEGDIGWVESQYITHEIPKVILIKELTEKIALLESKANNLENGQANSSENSLIDKKADDTRKENEIEYLNKIKSLETALASQIEKNRQLEAQLSNSYSGDGQELKPVSNLISTTGSAIQEENIDEEDIPKETPDYKKNGDLASSEEGNLSLPDDDLLKTAMIKWFCAGAGVLIAGWFIGRSFSGGRRSRGLLD